MVAEEVIKLCVPREDGNFTCEFDDDGNIRLYGYSFGYLNSPIATVSADGSIIMLTAYGSPSELEGTAELLTEKYGNALAVKETVRNKTGTKFTKMTYRWTDAAGMQLTIETMKKWTNSGELTILSSKEIARRERAAKEFNKALKDSL